MAKASEPGAGNETHNDLEKLISYGEYDMQCTFNSQTLVALMASLKSNRCLLTVLSKYANTIYVITIFLLV